MQDLPRAQLPSAFRTLFPAGVVAAELRGAGDVLQLLPAELVCLGTAAPQRAAEFAAGRQCARLALAQLDITNFALLTASDRCPVWPESVVGSITHTTGLCAAVVAPASRFLGLGVDTEVIANVRAELWPRICVPEEITWLDSLPVERRAAAAALVFTAKEAFYKCQSPLTDEWLNFKDLRVRLMDSAAAADPGTAALFEVIPVRPLALTRIVRPPYFGRFRADGQYLSAGLALTV